MTSLTMILSPVEDDWKPSSMNNKNENLSITVVTTSRDSSPETITPPITPASESTTAAAAPSTPPAVPSHYMNVIKEKKMNPCPHCHKKFAKPSALKAHLFTHTGEKPNSCPHEGCNSHFSLLSNLRRHLKIHSPESIRKQQQKKIMIDSSANKRRITRILPSPYTSTMKTLPGAPHMYPALRFETPITKD